MLALPELRQLNQRVTARYHLGGLERQEIEAYVRYRLGVAGLKGEVFSAGAIRALYRHSQGIPRLINLISDRALLGAYSEGEHQITAAHIRKAASEIRGRAGGNPGRRAGRSMSIAMLTGSAILALILTLQWMDGYPPGPEDQDPVAIVGDPDFVGAVERMDAQGESRSPEVVAEDPGDESFSFDDRMATLAGAFEALFGIWGRDYQISEAPVACDFAQSAGLRCLETRMSRQGLMFLNRPAILHLRNSSGQTGFVVLKAMSGQAARIATTNGERTVGFDSIEPFWHGQFTVLWKLPSYQQADRQVWLSASMMELASQLAANRTEEDRVVRMDSGEQVRWYQAKKGLTVDGIAGAMTIIQMHNDLNVPVPRLDSSVEQDG
jgi:general secretion pathway protein A